jgi:hypothetical protein
MYSALDWPFGQVSDIGKGTRDGNHLYNGVQSRVHICEEVSVCV